MLNLYGIVVAILKMATGRNFSMSGINLGHHNLPTYEMSLKSDNVEFVWHCGGHFENGDRQKFFNVGNQFETSLFTHISNVCGIVAIILKMATGRNFSMSRINSEHHYLDNVEFLPPIFYAVFWQPIFMSLSLFVQKLSTLMYEISTFPQDSIVNPTPFEPLKI